MSYYLPKVKENLILEHSADDGLIEDFITAAVGRNQVSCRMDR